MSNLAADRNPLLRKAPRTLDSLSGHATDLGRFNIFCENTNPNSFILESHKMKNNALNAFDKQNQSLTT